jgi:hypothetical protein
MRRTSLVIMVALISLTSLFVVMGVTSENTSDNCLKTPSETCTHFDSVSSVNYLDGPISVISPNGDYVVSIDDQTSKYSIYHSEELDTLSTGYLHPGESFSVDYNTNNLIIKNETNCYFPTEAILECNLEAMEYIFPSTTNEIIPNKLFLNDQSVTCELGDDWTNSCPINRKDAANDASIFSIGGGRGKIEMTTWSPDSNRVANIWTTRVDMDESFIENADDYDGVIIIGKAIRWELNRSGIQTRGVVASSISEYHISSDEYGASEDILGLTWAPNSQSLYVTTTNEIGVFSSSGAYSNMHSFSEDFPCAVEGEVRETDLDSVDYEPVPHQLSSDGSTLVITCTDGSQVTSVIIVFGESSNWWLIIGSVLFGIAVTAVYWNRSKIKEMWKSTRIKMKPLMSIVLILMIILPGCLGSPRVELPDSVSLSVDSAPNNENLLAIFDAEPEVPIDTIDIWVDMGDGGYWCSIRESGCTITGAETSNQGLWYYHPGGGMGAIPKEDWAVANDEGQNACESSSCEYTITVYYLGKRMDDFQIVQFGL